MACEVCQTRITTCAGCGKEFIMLPRNELSHSEEHRIALETTRTDLWGANEELRNKIRQLEEGQNYLLQKLMTYEREPNPQDDLDGIASGS